MKLLVPKQGSWHGSGHTLFRKPLELQAPLRVCIGRPFSASSPDGAQNRIYDRKSHDFNESLTKTTNLVALHYPESPVFPDLQLN
jgi:hypothetical protein